MMPAKLSFPAAMMDRRDSVSNCAQYACLTYIQRPIAMRVVTAAESV